MLKITDYHYHLPSALIAQEPAKPRDHSRLFIYDTQTDKIRLARFYNLSQFLPPKSFLVFNDTKVAPARLTMHKETSGKVKLLFLVNEVVDHNTRFIRAFVDRQVKINDCLNFEKNLTITAVKQEENIFTFRLSFPYEKLKLALETAGAMPIPPYIKHSPLTSQELREKYQTVFAKKWGSAAAPTAALHFTKHVFSDLIKSGIDQYFITLQVGLGTFAPINEENISQKKLHAELVEVNCQTLKSIKLAKVQGKQLVAVGTTVVRSLESLVLQKKDRFNSHFSTELFIFPPYQFKMVDGLITNFHLPKSSLMMLVEAFLQYKKAKRHLVDLYSVAITEGFCFYSFGDAMFII
ncbi:tRNA preQ1(34) S-adenosylmethionine ribosyltransferase-isomerase QueA [Candidatus Roizmanbacteria bacterium RIFCSPHIGHO2_12_FULL_41_11]|uniref:S-adenosylmethionine:tRNA ribosyltransferase-isomerase n=2 Tax=Candidatus Roizmaniibacteriota TaxID=1752723 RepID=A0A1F7J6W3_9BACT|nr:MAG: tRNA preQ1(34) S-adenosylmethionine ribosyltransferase-isomerase QueA [Candidatus Roizmanbacteria bacterium RIFCSPHIGHO2_12_FULL_41_11]OGK51355.1 MAG: tRNA preQ1(34) S-adenosylmethionine ribosyltransferase-isomerase QueA [Candidatus Roizmanbacteria bacterium RIFCSPLOWO2_01_FULL_41_22]